MPYKDPDVAKRKAKERYERNRPARTASMRKRYQTERQRISEIKANTPCADCKGFFHPFVMDFDHVRGEKLGDVSRLARSSTSEAVDAEIQKCELVCSNCHRLRTWNRLHSGRKRPIA